MPFCLDRLQALPTATKSRLCEYGLGSVGHSSLSEEEDAPQGGRARQWAPDLLPRPPSPAKTSVRDPTGGSASRGSGDHPPPPEEGAQPNKGGQKPCSQTTALF